MQDSWLEGWLSIPSKQNIRRHGWRKQYVVVSSKKIFFYNSESDKNNAKPILILDLNKVFHVRSVTQGDVIRADAKEIPRIFQIIYAGEGESRKPDESTPPPDLVNREEKSGTVSHKGHELVAISFHMPTTCEVCSKPLWHMFRPPPALECRRCRMKGKQPLPTRSITELSITLTVGSIDHNHYRRLSAHWLQLLQLTRFLTRSLFMIDSVVADMITCIIG